MADAKQKTPDAGIPDKLKGYNETMTISQAVVFFGRHGYGITKTMIQNYVRVGALPLPADKRRYTKNHILTILLIDQLKTVFSLDEIKMILGPAIENVFVNGGDMSAAYGRFCEIYENKLKNEEAQKETGRVGPFDDKLSLAAECAALRRAVTESNGEVE